MIESSSSNQQVAVRDEWQRLGVHRGSEQAQQLACPTGWPGLDAILPGGGFPLGAVTELLVAEMGSGELSLLLPSLSQRMAYNVSTRVVILNPPHAFGAQALIAAGLDFRRMPVIRSDDRGERIWSIEQIAASVDCGALVLWDNNIDSSALRRLQLASEKASCPVFVFREIQAARHRSPAALRLAITSRGQRQRLEILKCRGPAGARLEGLQMHRDTPWHWSLNPRFVVGPQQMAAGNDH